jgi:preprotein translocase subunit YajC
MDQQQIIFTVAIFIALFILIILSVYFLAKQNTKKKDKMDSLIKLINTNYDHL